MGYLNNYDVKEIIFENNLQRITRCMNNENETEFYNNIIMAPRIIELIDSNLLVEQMETILASTKNEDRAYIATSILDSIPLEDYIIQTDLTMSDQLNLTERLLDTFLKLEEYPDLIQESMIQKDNILVADGEIVLRNLLKFSQAYDISESVLVKEVGNYIHFIYAKSYIDNYEISEKLPPDIKRLVMRCFSNQYMHIGQVCEAFKSSPTYALVAVSNNSIQSESQFDVTRLETNEDKESETTEPLEETKMTTSKTLRGVAIALIIAIPLLFLLLTRCDSNADAESDLPNIPPINDEIQYPSNDQTQGEPTSPNLPETINEYYNDELLQKAGSEKVAEIDFSKFYDGYSSLRVDGKVSSGEKTLFAVVDLKSDDFSYLKNRQVGLSMRLTTETEGLSPSVIVEVIENGEISTYSNEKVDLTKNLWTLSQTAIMLGDAERIDVFIVFNEEASVWIDGIEVDILK
jgi:hypothetical protein